MIPAPDVFTIRFNLVTPKNIEHPKKIIEATPIPSGTANPTLVRVSYLSGRINVVISKPKNSWQMREKIHNIFQTKKCIINGF